MSTSRSSRPLLSLALAAVLAAAAAATWTPGPPTRMRPTSVRRAATSTSDSPTTELAALPPRPAEAQAVRASAAVDVAGRDAARLDQAVAELAAALADPDLDLARWTSMARSHALSLGPGHVDELLRRADEGSREPRELIAIAKLVRHAPDAHEFAPADLPPALLWALRQACRDRESDLGGFAAACGSMAVLGDAGDRLALLEAMTDGDPRVRQCAASALALARGTEPVQGLLGLLGDPARSDVTGLALTALQGIAARNDLSACAPAVEAVVLDDEAGLGLRRRAIATLVTLDPAGARWRLADLLADPGVEPRVADAAGRALARLVDAQTARELEQRLIACAPVDARGLVVATTLEASAVESPLASDYLRRTLRDSTSRLHRRSAILALARGGEDEASRDALRQAAEHDPDPGARTAARSALEPR